MTMENRIDLTNARPILFSTEMVKAILAGIKTETRRLIRFPADWDKKTVYLNPPFGIKYGSLEFGPKDPTVKRLFFRGGCKGDYLWVRETFYALGRWVHAGFTKKGNEKHRFEDLTENMGHEYMYEAASEIPYFIRTDYHTQTYWHKRPAIFMPKIASRILLRITHVTAQRLQDISDEDCINEGMLINKDTFIPGELSEAFKKIWIQINGRESWDLNPWVWVIRFKVHTKS